VTSGATGVAGVTGVAGATPATELGEGLTEGTAATVGFTDGFGVALGDGAITFELADFVGFAAGLVLVTGDGLDGAVGLTLAVGVASGVTVGIGFWVTSTSGGNGSFAPASFTLCSGARSCDSWTNPETIATKATKLTPVANKRLRNAGFNRTFMFDTPS
jgi:hypothetical protein